MDFMEPFSQVLGFAYDNFLLSRSSQDYIFSSDGVMHLTYAAFVIMITYFVFRPKHFTPSVYMSTVGDELDEVKPSITTDSQQPNVKLSASQGGSVVEQTRPAPKKALPRKVEMVKTPLGPVRVTIVGDTSANGKLLTFHDIATNHRTCFSRFFQLRRGEERDKKVWEQFSVYHIDAPGHEEAAEDLVCDSMSLDDLVAVVKSVVDHFKMGAFVGFGVGAGANVLLRYAAQNPQYVRALIVVGTSAQRASKNEQWYYWTVLKILEKYGMNEYAVDLLAKMHFSAATCAVGQFGVHYVASYRDTLRHDLNHRNLAKYMHAYKERSSINTHELNNALRTSKVLCMASNGSASPSYMPFLLSIDRVTPANKLFQALDVTRDNRVATWVGATINKRGHLVTEEKPEVLYQVISLFLESVGFVA